MTINYADGKGTLLKQVKSGRSSGDADMYGRVEDSGWDPETNSWPGASTPQVRTGINRNQQLLDVMEQVARPKADGNRRPNAQTPNVRVQGGRMSNYGDE